MRHCRVDRRFLRASTRAKATRRAIKDGNDVAGRYHLGSVGNRPRTSTAASGSRRAPAVAAAPVDRGFHEFASEWIAAHAGELRETTIADYTWQLSTHLLSGSVYHRFPTRAALLSALWLRTLDRFHAGLLDAAAAGDPVRVAQHTITWSREHPREARILLYGAADFAQHEWPPGMQQRRNDAQQCVAAAFDRLGRRIGVRGRCGRERIVFALADIPLALVRRHLNAGKPIPIDAEDLVATTTRALLAAEG